MVQSATVAPKNLRLINGFASAAAVPEQQHDFSAMLSTLPMRLQTTLELSQLLNIVNDQCLSLFGECAVNYQNVVLDLQLQFGKRRAHHCDYQLEIDQQSLGQVSVSRHYRFSETEILLIEEMFCKVVYPLRNCLMYRSAVQSAKTDSLTGLPNRQAFEVMIEREMNLAQRLSSPLCLLVIDIDNFKQINDTFGHSHGDQALVDTAAALLLSLRRSDISFRYGGEEFVVLLSQCDAQAAAHVAERLRQDIEKMHTDESAYGAITVSIGLSQHQPSDSVSQLFDRADKALYKAKAEGRNQVVAEL